MGKTKLNIPMLAALILLLLTMVTTHFTSGLYARYSSYATGSDSARVAKFAVTGSVEPVTGQNGKYEITVDNDSEVAVEYCIDVKIDPHLSVTIGNETKRLETGNTVVSFTNENWKLAPDTAAEPLEMTIAVADWSGITNRNTNNGTTETVTFNFEVNVIAMQID